MRKLNFTTVLLLLCALSCVPLHSDLYRNQQVSLEDIQDVWIAVDTSKFVFIKMNLKTDGNGEIFWAFPKSEKHTFVINHIDLNRNMIRLSIITDENSAIEFTGSYDRFMDSLNLNIDSFDFNLLFLRASQLPI